MTPGELLFVLSLLAAFLAVATAVSGRSRILRAWNLGCAVLCAACAVVSLIWL
jgi:hypothetical protein